MTDRRRHKNFDFDLQMIELKQSILGRSVWIQLKHHIKSSYGHFYTIIPIFRECKVIGQLFYRWFDAQVQPVTLLFHD